LDGCDVSRSARNRAIASIDAGLLEIIEAIMIGRGARANRRDASDSVEFADLLDPISVRSDEPEPQVEPAAVVEEAEEVQPAVATADEVEPTVVTSRFDGAGIDDDRLPRHAPKRSRLHR
jgi:hypothetical protein